MKKDIKVLIGKAVDTKKNISIDFFNEPHLLVSGCTGSGKSNFLLSVIVSLTKRFTPKELRLILADPKRVEFSRFGDSQYLDRPVIMTTKKALDAVKYLEEEMESRYEDLQREGASLNLSDDETAFYDALCDNESAVMELGDEILKAIARELVTMLRKNTSIDWTLKQNVQAKLRVLVKKMLNKYKYPPDKQETATKTVLEQAEVLCRDWNGE